MNTQMLQIAEQLKEAYGGEPWFGKCAVKLLEATTPQMAMVQPQGQHSILELVWHMINWKSFAISRLRKDSSLTLHQFEANDWRPLNHEEERLWPQGLQLYHQAHNELVELVQQQTDDLLAENVFERDYSYHQLLHGILQHDVYHLGQIAYIQKLLSAGGK